VVTYRSAGACFLLTHGVDGFIVQPGDIKGLSDYIGRLISSPNLIRVMGDMAYRRSKDFRTKSVCAGWLDLLGRLGVLEPGATQVNK
jgi:glycosyltransferase involved in cell wall biosynthesis